MRYIKIGAIILFNGILISGCGSSDVIDQNIGDNQNQIYSIAEIELEELSNSESEGLIFLREEEKLARDVYAELYKSWGIRAFNNINNSEQRHMDAIKTLLDRYELDDPVQTDIPGVFANQDLQELYNDLIEQGKDSEIEALKVGALIEEVDIEDIQRELDENVDNQDIFFVYDNLLNGSYNHLRAFVRNLSRWGIIYTPQILSEEKFNEIINQ